MPDGEGDEEVAGDEQRAVDPVAVVSFVIWGVIGVGHVMVCFINIYTTPDQKPTDK